MAYIYLIWIGRYEDNPATLADYLYRLSTYTQRLIIWISGCHKSITYITLATTKHTPIFTNDHSSHLLRKTTIVRNLLRYFRYTRKMLTLIPQSFVSAQPKHTNKAFISQMKFNFPTIIMLFLLFCCRFVYQDVDPDRRLHS